MADTMYARIEGGAIVDWSTIPTQPPLTVRKHFTGPASVTNALGQTVELLDDETREIEIANPEPQKDWRPLVQQWPDFDKLTHQVGNPSDTVQADKVVRSWVVSQRSDLDPVKAELKAKLGADAEAARLRFITAGSGKSLSYQEKLAEARLILDDPDDIDAILVPILAAEAVARGITIKQAAENVHAAYLSFKAIEAQINAMSIIAAKAISDASDAAAARAAYEAITWPATP